MVLSVRVITWCRQIQLCPPELRHGRLKLFDDQVIFKEEVLGQGFLQELHQLLHREFQHVFCERNAQK